RDPVLWRDITDGDGTARLHGSVARGPQPGPQRLLARLAKRRCPLRGRMLQDTPYDPPIPHGLARAGHLPRLGQPATHRPNRQAVASDPGTNLADHTGFVRAQLLAGLATPRISGDLSLPRERAAPH